MSKKNAWLAVLRGGFFLIYVSSLSAGVYLLRTSARSEIQKPDLGKNLRSVLPDFDNDPSEEAFEIDRRTVYPARKQQLFQLDAASAPLTAHVLNGFAFQMPWRDGEGPNPVWAGVDLEGKVLAVRPEFERKARVPENQMTDTVSAAAREFFLAHRPDFFQKANEVRT